MNDLISRQDAIYALLEKGQKSRRYKVGEIWELNFDEIREALATVPSAEPKKGKWIDFSDEGYVECPYCHSATNCDGNKEELHYCYSCGADMRESE